MTSRGQQTRSDRMTDRTGSPIAKRLSPPLLIHRVDEAACTDVVGVFQGRISYRVDQQRFSLQINQTDGPFNSSAKDFLLCIRSTVPPGRRTDREDSLPLRVGLSSRWTVVDSQRVRVLPTRFANSVDSSRLRSQVVLIRWHSTDLHPFTQKCRRAVDRRSVRLSWLDTD